MVVSRIEKNYMKAYIHMAVELPHSHPCEDQRKICTALAEVHGIISPMHPIGRVKILGFTHMGIKDNSGAVNELVSRCCEVEHPSIGIWAIEFVCGR